MVWKASAIFLTIFCLCCAVPAAAQDSGRVCFDPGTTRLSPEGYVEVRRIAAEMEAGVGPTHIIQRRPARSGGAPSLNDYRRYEVRLELRREGVDFGEMEVVEGGVEEADCLTVEIDRSDSYGGLWHYWGPFFATGDATISVADRDEMRTIVVDYRPGETKYCIEAHTDAAGSAEANMELSRRRAENVALELVRQGVRWEDTRLRWYGERAQARPMADGVAEPLNRRAFVDVRRGCRPDH